MATGAVQYVFGGVGYDQPLGIVSGGEWGDDANPITVEGIGGVGVIVPGPVAARATLEIAPVDEHCLLDKILRVAGTYGGYPAGLPPAVPLHLGDDASGIISATWRISSATVRLAVNDVLRVSNNLVAVGKPSRGVNAAEYDVPRTPFVWHDGHVHVDDDDCNVISAEFSIENGLDPAFTLNEKSAGSRRWNEDIDVGPEVIGVTLVFRENPGHELDGDALETADLLLTVQNLAETPLVATFEAEGGKVVGQSTSLQTGGGVREWTARYVFDYSTEALSIGLP